MTQGRFDTVPNCRPAGWDSRRHWTNWHHECDCAKDHQERESCPFHDLRAGGQFQYEYGGSGVGGVLVEPERLTRRSDAKHMVHGHSKQPGVGGLGIPNDTEAGRPQMTLKRPVDGKPWSSVNRLKNGLFSAPGYIPCGEESKLKKLKGLPPSSAAAGDFVGGSKAVPFLHKFAEHVSDPYNDKIDRGRIFHLKAGRAKPIEDSRTRVVPCPEAEKRRHNSAGPFYAGKAPGATFGGTIETLPEPYDFAKIKNEKRPLFTWYTHSKWSMPTEVPWTTGKTTAEAKKGSSLATSLVDVPCVTNLQLTQTIGSEAALNGKPSPVEFRR